MYWKIFTQQLWTTTDCYNTPFPSRKIMRVKELKFWKRLVENTRY